jgi:glycosyltransferase involved in cell wall biosynthesis
MRKNQCKISVIVPVYNKKEYLKDCIDSIVQQTYRNLELILVDDGSEDGSDELCEQYEKKDTRVRLIRQENAGPTAACVNGMKNATGSHYMFIDSDDYVEKNMLEKMASLLHGAPGEIVCCNHILEKKRKTEKITMRLAPGAYEGEKLRNVKENLLGNEQRIIPMSRCMKLCEKSVFEGNEVYYDYSIRMGDDFHLIYPALLAANRIVIMEEAYFYHYRYVETSIVHRYDPHMFDSVEAWYLAMRRIIADKKVGDGEARLRREYCYMLMLVVKNELRNPEKGYRKRIQEIFREENVREVVQNTPLMVTSRNNQLMYLAMTYPATTLLWMLRMILKVHDR